MLGSAGFGLTYVAHLAVQQLNNALLQLGKNTRELQDEVIRIRMLPISFVFNRFSRLVHAVSHKLGKQVKLKLSGEQTELDKTVIEKIGDPLMHLTRNAPDHGVELPQDRVDGGKAECGVVELEAYHQGGFIVIQVKDDGRGLDTQRIHEKALASGFISHDTVLSNADIHELIFRPGLSTMAAANDLSGRGVGMDVVRKNIEELGEYVFVSSEPDDG